MRAFQMDVAGMRYWGSWLQQGPNVKVRCDYGSATFPLDGRDPRHVAREGLLQLLPPRPSWR